MKFKKIRTKMLLFILPVIITALVALTLISAVSCKNIVNKQIRDTMNATLNARAGDIEASLNTVASTAAIISHTVAATYNTLSLADYEAMLTDIITDNDMVLGSGIWFAPYAYDMEEEYVGPYIFKDGEHISVTYDYSNADYDYFSQEYYKLAEASSTPVITDPYYDETSGLIMSTCSMALYDENKFIGCITVDIELSSIKNAVDSIKAGEGGSAILLTQSGVYLGGVSDEKVSGSVSILDESNQSLSSAGSKILSSENGQTEYTDDNGSLYNLYYQTIDATGWHIIIQMPQAELFTPTLELVQKLAVVCCIALICSVIAVLIQVASISRSIRRVQSFAGSLASGDFTINSLSVKSKDELGRMGHSLNEMYANNKEVINNISDHAVHINDSSKRLKDSSSKLLQEFSDIQNSMNQINQAMTSVSAATQQVNASTEEVDAAVSILASETENSMSMSNEIRQRASAVETTSRASYDSATQLSTRFHQQLQISIENAKVVENIGELAHVIAEIAEQINLLSLNASIEAARAGEQGRGFSVVASEIGKLAGETASAVGSIQTTITQVQAAFQQLTGDAREMLSFVQNTVTPDYNHFVDTASQYGQDAVSIADTSCKISEMASNIRHVMNEVTQAIENIAESSQETTNVSGLILESVDEVSQTVNEVSHMSNDQQDIANDLDMVVKKFQL